MQVHRRVTPSSMSPVPIYTPGWREKNWSKVPCLRKQRDERGLNPGPPDPEFEVLTARPHTIILLKSSNKYNMAALLAKRSILTYGSWKRSSYGGKNVVNNNIRGLGVKAKHQPGESNIKTVSVDFNMMLLGCRLRIVRPRVNLYSAFPGFPALYWAEPLQKLPFFCFSWLVSSSLSCCYLRAKY